ncbi:DUF6637 family protein [Anaerocolumna sp. AGMB13020]|uniref:DUF6637 family protein n=1 Tax=Anaerocolumna sp. AGMB13020 TaxID=3081750 RepID=UPI002952BE61|nr:DUF6637 family protein [Anaerocolumna sp. AGMB13020]WOO38752.1 DUF6637 family protein [Anaerocolumna sp. AGMB13020]
MNKLITVIKEQKLALDIINVAIGCVIIILAVFYFMDQDNILLMSVVLFLAGTINILNGVKRLKSSNKKNSIGFFAVGVIIYFVAASFLAMI